MQQTEQHPPNRQGEAAEPVYIETPSYRLRSLTTADASPEFLGWLNDPEMLQGLNLPPLNFTMERLVQFIAGFDNKHSYIIGIFAKAQAKLIGFFTIDVNLTHRTGQMTTGIGDRAFWGKDALVETCLALRDHFFAHRNLDKLTARILANNRKVLFNFIGSPDFLFEAKLRQECLGQNGERLDILVFSAYKNP